MHRTGRQHIGLMYNKGSSNQQNDDDHNMRTQQMKTDYLNGITIVKRFLDDIDLLSQNKTDAIDLAFYKRDFEKLLLYISKSFLSDNYDELYEKLDDEVPKTVFNQKCFLDPDKKHSQPLSLYLCAHQYCKMPKRLLEEPMNAYKVVVRNPLCHYEYKIAGDRIIVEKVDHDEGAELSIATIVKLLKDTLSSYGHSKKEGAYDYWFLLSQKSDQSCMFLIKNLDNNPFAPAWIIARLQNELSKNNIYGASPAMTKKYLEMTLGRMGRYYIKRQNLDPEIMKKAGITKVSNKEDVDLYMCAHDEIKRAGITYNLLVDIIFSMHMGEIKDFPEKYGRFYEILSNTVFISYMSLVFDDLFAKNFNGTINSGLFLEKSEVEDVIIPWKFRNSLAHSRYRFENIFDSSGSIIIEFWDEDKNGVNFRCKITKDNAIKLIDDYLAQCKNTLPESA